MVSDNTNIQPPISDLDIAQLRQNARLSITSEYEQMPEVIKIGEAVAGTLGNFSAAIGKAKSKKTFNCSAIVASALTNNSVLGYTSCFPIDKRKILYVDTEQGVSHCQKVLNRIYRLAGLSLDQDSEYIEFLALRKYTPEVRIRVIDEAIRETAGLGLVIIDGIRDLVYDINNSTEATNTISLLMQWTDEFQIHIHVILHQNKGDDNARGHIGTELINKAETVLQIERDKDDNNVSRVEALFIRDKDFQPFAFRINDEILPELVEGYTFDKKVGRPKKENLDPYLEIPVNVHVMAVEIVFKEENKEYGYKELQASLKAAYAELNFQIGDSKVVKIITSMSNKRILIKNERGKTILNPLRHW